MNIYRIFEYTSYLLDFYMLLISLRIILSWFAGGINNQAVDILRQITDPYLNLFRRIRFLKFGMLDMSPLLGIFGLIFLSTLLKRFALGNISVAVTLFTLIESVFMGVSSIASLFAFITVIRIVGLFIRASSVEQLWYRLDAFLQPLVSKLITSIVPKRSVPYGTALGVFLAATFIISIGLRYLIGPMASLILRIPF